MTLASPALVVVFVVIFAVAVAVTFLAMRGRTPAIEARLASAEAELKTREDELRQSRNEAEEARQEVATLQERLRQVEKQSEEKLRLLQDARQELTNQFEVLANKIFEVKGKDFTEQNKNRLKELLDPLSTQIEGFKRKVEEVYTQEGKDRSALSAQVELMMSLNKQLSEDTSNLTRALTTSGKAQGDLGEVILERILEASGLRKDHEYRIQASYKKEEEGHSRPDVVINLPEDKHLVIDSKVSLTAYNEFVNAQDDNARKDALNRHVLSVRQHVKELSISDYQSIHQLRSIDFVCMFVPIEGAFLLAISNDPDLWRGAYEKNVLIVSASTLLFVVRTVAHLWRQERQKENVAEIVRRGAELYDKFVGFVEDLKSVGERLDQAKSSFQDAYSKLATGKGNAIRQAEMLKELGIQPKKALPADLVEASSEEAPALPGANSPMQHKPRANS